jgi:hypothetical protein
VSITTISVIGGVSYAIDYLSHVCREPRTVFPDPPLLIISAFSGTLGCGDLMIFSIVPDRVTLTFSGIKFPLARVAGRSVAGIQSCFCNAMLRLGVEAYSGWSGRHLCSAFYVKWVIQD